MSVVLESPQSLVQDKVFTSPSGATVKVQADGNVVIAQGSKPIWGLPKLPESASPPYSLELQNDGNLVLYDSKRTAVWATGTNAASTVTPFVLLLTDDAALELADGEGRLLWRNVAFPTGEPSAAIVVKATDCPLLNVIPAMAQASYGSNPAFRSCTYSLRALTTEKALGAWMAATPTAQDTPADVKTANEAATQAVTKAFCAAGLNSSRAQCKPFCDASPDVCVGFMQSYCSTGNNMQKPPCSGACGGPIKAAWCPGAPAPNVPAPPVSTGASTGSSSSWTPARIAALVLGILAALAVLYAIFSSRGFVG